MERVWDIMCEELTYAVKDKNLVIHSFVLMNNHFHLIASTPDANISACMLQFMRRTSLRLTREGNRINETFAGRHYKCILQHHNYFLNAYKYNYRNPVSAGLCTHVENYPFSTLPMKLGLTELKLPLIDDTTLDSDQKGTLRWLNTEIDPLKRSVLRFGFRHQYFRSRINKYNKQPIIGISDLL